MRARHGARKSSGFTLIELIVVMTLLSVAVGLAIPRLNSFFRGRTLDSEARRLLAYTRYAQSRATSEGVPVKLWVDIKNNSFGVEADPTYQQGGAGDMQCQVDPAIHLEIPAASRVSAPSSRSATQVNAATVGKYAQLPGVRFLPDGSMDDSSLDRMVLRDAEDYTVTIVRSQNRLGFEISAK